MVAVKTNRGSYQADAVIVAAGFVPNTSFLNDQLELLGNGAIKIDTYGRTSQKMYLRQVTVLRFPIES